MAKFQYRAPTKESLNKRANQSGAFDKILKADFTDFKPSPKENRIRILPASWDDAEHFGFDLWIHGSVGPDNSTYLCRNKMKGEDTCPICAEAAAALRDGDKEYAQEIRAYRKVGVFVVDREDEDKGVQFWGMPATIDKSIVASMADEESGNVILVDHPDEGYDVLFSKVGEKRNTKYEGIRIARRSTPLSDDAKKQAKWLQFITDHPLPKALNYYPAEYIAKVHAGKAKKEEDEDAPKTRHGEKPKKDRDLDDDEDAPKSKKTKPADDEGDDEPKPKKQATDDDGDDVPRRRASKPADDEGDDEPKPKKSKPANDDDDDATKPKKKAASDDDDEPKAKKPKERDTQEGDHATVTKTGRKGVVVRVDDDGVRVKFADDTKKTYDADELEIRFADGDDEPKPSKAKADAAKRTSDDDGDDEPKPKKKAVVEDDGDDEPKPKKKAASNDDDEDDAPKPKKKPAVDDDDGD